MHCKIVLFAVVLCAGLALPAHAQQDEGKNVAHPSSQAVETLTDERAPSQGPTAGMRTTAARAAGWGSLETAPAAVLGGAAAQTPSGGAETAPRVALSGDVRVRYEHTTTDEGIPERDRGVVRARLNAQYSLSPNIAFGLRVATGDLTDPRTTDVTLGDFAHKLQANLDRVFVTVRGGPVALTAGRMPNPFVASELAWDGDVNPHGVAGELVLPKIGRLTPSVTSMLFVVDELTAASDSTMLGTQVLGKLKLSPAATLTLGGAYYDYRMLTLSKSDVRGNLLTADGKRYLSDFDLVSVLGRLTYGRPETKWPVTFLTEYIVNRGTAGGANDDGFDVEIDVGRSRVKGAMRARYGYMTADRDAVLNAFSHDNIPLASGYRMHTFGWDWYQRKDAFVNVTLYVFRDTLVPSSPYHARLRLNFTVEF